MPLPAVLGLFLDADKSPASEPKNERINRPGASAPILRQRVRELAPDGVRRTRPFHADRAEHASFQFRKRRGVASLVLGLNGNSPCETAVAARLEYQLANSANSTILILSPRMPRR